MLAVGASLLLAAAPIGAEEPSLAEELLEVLRESGDISEERYQELKEKARRDETPADDAGETGSAADTPAAESTPPVSDEPTWSAGWNNGFYVKRSDGVHSLEFGGRIQNDWAYIDQSDGLDNSVSGGKGFGTEFRRARLFMSGTFYEYGIFKSEYDFADGDADFKDVYVGLEFKDAGWRAQIGHQKEPMSLQQMTSSKYLVFMERGVSDALIPGRNTGFYARTHLLEQRMTLAAGVFQDSDDFGNGFSREEDQNVTFRVTALPYTDEDGRNLVHLGASYSHQFKDDGDPVRYRTRAETNLGERLIDTGDIAADDVDLMNLSAAWLAGPFALQGEYTRNWLDADDMGDPSFWGAYVQASWFLTGENRRYSRAHAAFGRVSPKKNFNPATGDWGAFEVAARYSTLDLNDDDVRGGILQNVTIGVNWYLFPNARVMANYVYGHRNGGGTQNAGQMRFMVDF